MIFSLGLFSKKVKDQISLERLQIFSIIKKGLLHHLGLSSTKFDTFMKEAIIESANNKENIDIKNW